MKKIIIVGLLVLIAFGISAQTVQDIDRVKEICKNRAYDWTGDNLITDIDYCITFRWYWNASNKATIWRCWTTTSSFRHLIMVLAWNGTSYEGFIVDPLDRVKTMRIEEARDMYIIKDDVTDEFDIELGA
jgi:hypothetical protein